MGASCRQVGAASRFSTCLLACFVASTFPLVPTLMCAPVTMHCVAPMWTRYRSESGSGDRSRPGPASERDPDAIMSGVQRQTVGDDFPQECHLDRPSVDPPGGSVITPCSAGSPPIQPDVAGRRELHHAGVPQVMARRLMSGNGGKGSVECAKAFGVRHDRNLDHVRELAKQNAYAERITASAIANGS